MRSVKMLKIFPKRYAKSSNQVRNSLSQLLFQSAINLLFEVFSLESYLLTICLPKVHHLRLALNMPLRITDQEQAKNTLFSLLNLFLDLRTLF